MIGWKHKMHVQNYYTDLDGVKVQQIINAITKEYVYAGLGGFPELPSAQPQSNQMPVQPPAPMVFNPSILASLPPPPGFKMPVGPNGMPIFPPPPMMSQGGATGPGMPPMPFHGMVPPFGTTSMRPPPPRSH